MRKPCAVLLLSMIFVLLLVHICDAVKPTPTPPPTPMDPAIAYEVQTLSGTRKSPVYLNHIYVMQADGTRQSLLLQGLKVPGKTQSGYTRPSMSPDGTQMVVEAMLPNMPVTPTCYGTELRVVTFNTTPQVLSERTLTDCNLTNALNTGVSPRWSPVGPVIAFVVGDDSVDTFEIHVTSPTAYNSSTVVYSTTNALYDITWNPDGTKIAFAERTGASVQNHTVLRILDLAESQVTDIIPTDEYVFLKYDWSRDGSLIAFSGYDWHLPRSQSHAVYTVDVILGLPSVTMVPNTRDNDGGVSWAPDDSAILHGARLSLSVPTTINEVDMTSFQVTVLASNPSQGINWPDRRRF